MNLAEDEDRYGRIAGMVDAQRLQRSRRTMIGQGSQGQPMTANKITPTLHAGEPVKPRDDRPAVAQEHVGSQGSLPVRPRRDMHSISNDVVSETWPSRPTNFPELLTPVEAAQYLRLDELGTHTPASAIRTLNFWRDRAQLRATKFARRVWYRRSELDRFLAVKTEA